MSRPMTDRDLSEAREALERVRDYFDQRADADYDDDTGRACGNAEMNRLTDCDAILAALTAAEQREQQARAEAFREAIVIANGAARAGDKCQEDGGCRHVPCLVARQIAGEDIEDAPLTGGELDPLRLAVVSDVRQLIAERAAAIRARRADAGQKGGGG